MNVSAWSIRNPIPSVLLFIMLTLMGLMGFRSMKVQSFPDIDLPAPGAARAGMFARGDFAVSSGQALTLPQTAVLLRDGFSYVLKVGADSKVRETKVGVGRRSGDRIEITTGLDASARVVAAGGGFLVDGDTVRVVDAANAAMAAPASAAVASK